MTSHHTPHLLNAEPHWWHRLHLSSQKFAIIVTISAFVTGLAYVAMTNSAAANGFAIDTLQSQLTALQASNEKLQLQAADLRSLAAADVAGQALGLQPTDTFTVLASTSGAVALKTP